MPGDEDPYYTSPWAGANYLPWVMCSVENYQRLLTGTRVSKENSREAIWDKETFPVLLKLAEENPKAGVNIQSLCFPSLVVGNVLIAMKR